MDLDLKTIQHVLHILKVKTLYFYNLIDHTLSTLDNLNSDGVLDGRHKRKIYHAV